MNVLLNNITLPAQRQLFFHVDVRCGVLGRNKILFYKIILNVKSSTSNTDVYDELGRYTLHINRCVRIIKYWGKIIQSDSVLIKILFNDMFIACNNGVTHLTFNVKQLLDKYGFSHVFRDPHLKNHSTFFLNLNHVL